MSVFIYARISRDDNNGETISNQLELLREFVKRQEFGDVSGEFADDNVSGVEFERVGLNELQQQINNGWKGILVIKDLSRLGRNNAKTLLFLDWLEQYGIRVVTADFKYDSSNDNDLVGIETWYNEKYVKDISAKTRASIAHLQDSGLYIPKACYGYRKIDKVLVICEREASVVRQIFAHYLNGMTMTEIASAFNSAAIPSPGAAQNGKWSVATVSAMLSNQTYLGHTTVSKTMKMSYKNKKIIRKPASEWKVFENTHSPIIPNEIFAKVQQLKAFKPNGWSVNSSNYSNILFCGECGAKMYKRGSGYICSTYVRYGKQKCKRNYVAAAKVKSVTEEYLSVNEAKCITTECEANEVKYSENIDAQAKVEKMYLDYIDGLIDKPQYLKFKRLVDESVVTSEKSFVKIKKTARIRRILVFKNVIIVN